MLLRIIAFILRCALLLVVCHTAVLFAQPASGEGRKFADSPLDQIHRTASNGQQGIRLGVAFAVDEPGTPEGDDVKKKKKPKAFDLTESYDQQTIEGWAVRVNPRLLTDEPELYRRTMQVLQMQLFQITRVVPAPALAKLRTIPIWVEKESPLTPCMCYHVDKGWVTEHGLNPEKTKSVELANPRHFLDWTIIQPWMLLHELAHGYHDRFMTKGHENLAVIKAYDAAMKEQMYDSVQAIQGGNRRAYAATNPQEYFAELTEAFFGTNDFYPFVRSELKEHDPRGYEMIKKAWGVEGR